MSTFLIVCVALLHLGFLVLEMFLWRKPIGMKVFRMDVTFAERSASLAANQGLYNGFLSAGLLWSLHLADPESSHESKIFFLSCVMIAGVYGAWSVSPRILIVQALPAALAAGALIAGF